MLSNRTAVGLRCKDGIVFAVEKLVTSKLHEPGSDRRLFTVEKHIGVVSRCGVWVWSLLFARLQLD